MQAGQCGNQIGAKVISRVFRQIRTFVDLRRGRSTLPVNFELERPRFFHGMTMLDVDMYEFKPAFKA